MNLYLGLAVEADDITAARKAIAARFPPDAHVDIAEIRRRGGQYRASVLARGLDDTIVVSLFEATMRVE